MDAAVPSPPNEDRNTSPRTGWVRAHWEWASDVLLDGVRSYASPRHALISLPPARPSRWGARSDAFEGFARTFLLAAIRIAGARGAVAADLIERYARGLDAGSEPRGEEAWPSIEDRSQPMVEAALIALALHTSRRWVWDRLSAGVQDRLVRWLSGVHGKRPHLNNWVLFPVLVNVFLASVGAEHRADEVERGLDLVDSWYRRDGWYTDGAGENFDHYNGWAIHLFTNWWALIAGTEADASRAHRYRERLARFLDDHRHLIGGDGAPLHHGRSLIYRFAAAAPLWMGALTGATPLQAGETRRACSGMLRYFLERGAVRDGVLTMGWHGEFLPMAQLYSGPASPYWAATAFLGLLIDRDDAVWTVPEEPLAVERADFCRAMPGPGYLVTGTAADGLVRASSHRSHHLPLLDSAGDPHYARRGFSTATAPVLGDGAAPDAQVCLVSPDGLLHGRALFHPVAVADRFAASVFFPGEPAILSGQPGPGWRDRVETVCIARGRTEIRIHHVSTSLRRTLLDGGAAVAGDDPPAAASGDLWSMVRSADGLTSALLGIRGYDSAGIARRENANAFGRHAATPTLATSADVPVEGVYVSLAVLTREWIDPQSLRDEIASLTANGREVSIVCRDGECFLVQLVEPEWIERTVGGRHISGRVRFARVSPDGSAFTLPG